MRTEPHRVCRRLFGLSHATIATHHEPIKVGQAGRLPNSRLQCGVSMVAVIFHLVFVDRDIDRR
jgi:hypothetical protein